MVKLKILVGLVGLGVGSQPYYGIDNQPFFISAWRSRIINHNPLAFKLTSLAVVENTATTPSDSNPRQKAQTDASRITLGKIALESVGAATGGILGMLTGSMIVGDVPFWQGAAAFVGTIGGLAGGATLVGNLVMEPNGSFIKSLCGTVVGAVVGSVFVTIGGGLIETKGTWNHMYWNPEPITYVCIIVAASLPISGVVIGYNHKGRSCCLLGTKDLEDLRIECEYLNGRALKLQVITAKF